MENVERTIISQYAQSSVIVQLIQNMNEYIDQRSNFTDFYNKIWNIETAESLGLDIWGKIVGIGRDLEVEISGRYFGFNGNGFPFGHGTFYPGSTATSTYRIADGAYRRLVLAKALANITRTTAPALNALLKNFFSGRGKCWCNDLGGMTMKYTFKFQLLPCERALIRAGTLLPRPAAVEIIAYEYRESVFGFRGNGVPFGQGTFINSQDIYAV